MSQSPATATPSRSGAPRTARQQAMKEHLANTLVEMCEGGTLEDITVKDLLARAGIARQTFYNHFVDINDLISYTASRPLLTNGLKLLEPENWRQALTKSLRHKEFFCQLGNLQRQNSYWPTVSSWTKRLLYKADLAGIANEHERQLHKLRIDIYVGGATELLKSWYAGGAQEPPDMVVDALTQSTPPFIRDIAMTQELVEPGDYPR